MTAVRALWPSGSHITTETVQFESVIAIRRQYMLEPEGTQGMHCAWGKAITAGFVAAGRVGVDKQCAQPGPLCGNRCRRASRARTHNDAIERKITHAAHCARGKTVAPLL